MVRTLVRRGLRAHPAAGCRAVRPAVLARRALAADPRPRTRLASTVGRPAWRRSAPRGADVVVCTYPAANQVLAVERLGGSLAVPLVSAVTDLAALRYWAHRGCDLHLVIHPESAAEIRAIAGADARIAPVRGLTTPRFERAGRRRAARAALGLPAHDARVVTVSGGGWGVGDLRGARPAALDAGPGVRVVALCGRNEAVRRRLRGAPSRGEREVTCSASPTGWATCSPRPTCSCTRRRA